MTGTDKPYTVGVVGNAQTGLELKSRLPTETEAVAFIQDRSYMSSYIHRFTARTGYSKVEIQPRNATTQAYGGFLCELDHLLMFLDHTNSFYFELLEIAQKIGLRYRLYSTKPDLRRYSLRVEDYVKAAHIIRLELDHKMVSLAELSIDYRYSMPDLQRVIEGIPTNWRLVSNLFYDLGMSFYSAFRNRRI